MNTQSTDQSLVLSTFQKSEDLEKILSSSRYKIVNSTPLGRGCWGVVYQARDTLLSHDVAIKIMNPTEVAQAQMQTRNLDVVSATCKEALRPAASRNIVPRTIELDSHGQPFIIMPIYHQFLSDKLSTATPKNTIAISEILTISEGIIKGIDEIHSTFKRAHADIKPDNIALETVDGKVDGKIVTALLNDLGTSTYVDDRKSIDPRDNMGYPHTRSPRLFKVGSHPDERSDCYAVGNLMYRLFTGSYLLESKNSTEEFNTDITPDQFSKLVKQKIALESIPMQFKQLIEDCLLEKIESGMTLAKQFSIAKKAYESSQRSLYQRLKDNWKSGVVALATIASFSVAGLIGFSDYHSLSVEHEKVTKSRNTLLEESSLSGRESNFKSMYREIFRSAMEDANNMKRYGMPMSHTPRDEVIQMADSDPLIDILAKKYGFESHFIKSVLDVHRVYTLNDTEQANPLYETINYFEPQASGSRYGRNISKDMKKNLEEGLILLASFRDQFRKSYLINSGIDISKITEWMRTVYNEHHCPSLYQRLSDPKTSIDATLDALALKDALISFESHYVDDRQTGMHNCFTQGRVLAYNDVHGSQSDESGASYLNELCMPGLEGFGMTYQSSKTSGKINSIRYEDLKEVAPLVREWSAASYGKDHLKLDLPQPE